MQTRTTPVIAEGGGEHPELTVHDERLPFQRRYLPADLGHRLRTARAVAGLSRREVALAARISPRTIARIERGAQKPLWSTVERLCATLKVSTFAIAGDRWISDWVDLPEDPVATPGIGIRRLRLARGFTLRQVADLVGTSVSSLSRFERGLTVSRALSSRDGPSALAYLDQDVILSSDALAEALGYADAASLRVVCAACPI